MAAALGVGPGLQQAAGPRPEDDLGYDTKIPVLREETSLYEQIMVVKGDNNCWLPLRGSWRRATCKLPTG